MILDDVKVGDKVLVAGLRRGIVRFVGETEFAPGESLTLRSPSKA